MDSAPTTRSLIVWWHPLLVSAAFWPVWLWYVQRTLDKSDEPWGLLALATAVTILLTAERTTKSDFRTEGCSIWQCLLGFGALALYVLTFPVAPNLLQAVFLVFTLWFLFMSRLELAGKAGLFGLLLISLPVIPSLNFFAGYPVRLITTGGVSGLFRLFGSSVIQDGTMLIVDQKPVAIDAPCSGISMLWVAFYLCMTTASLFKLGISRTLTLVIATAAAVILGNTLRASALVLFDHCMLDSLNEAGTTLEPVIHVGLGIAIFIFLTASIVGTGFALSATATKSDGTEIAAKERSTERMRITGSKWMGILWALCIIGGALPFLSRSLERPSPHLTQPHWPQTLNGERVWAVGAAATEDAFASDFPGLMKQMTDGKSYYFVRYVNRETRQLHSSSDCYRGIGYTISPQPLQRGADGTLWACFLATKDQKRYRVLEHIYDQQGSSYTDVSAWFWSATFGKTRGPWWAVTIAKPI